MHPVWNSQALSWTTILPCSVSTSLGIYWCPSVFSWPATPFYLSPHEYNAPVKVTATVCLDPHATDLTCKVSSPSTFRGLEHPDSDPWPSLPYIPHPPVQSSPLFFTAAVWYLPQVICVTTWPVRSATSPGTYFHPLSPWPGLPSSPLPQVNTSPSCVKIQVWPDPQANWSTATPRKASKNVGPCWSDVSPNPSWPSSPVFFREIKDWLHRNIHENWFRRRYFHWIAYYIIIRNLPLPHEKTISPFVALTG